MADPGTKALQDELGALPAGLDRLTDAERADLAAAIATIRAQQTEAMDVAIDRALQGVPRLLRGTARRVLLG